MPKLKLCTNPGAENLILHNINARRQLWSFRRIRNSKLSKKIAEANLAKKWSICQNFTSKRKQVMYNFANKGCNVMFVVIQFITV